MSIPPTLLLADDSLTIQRVVSLTFADQPVRVVVAKDGQDAINRMAKERPDVVLADTNMPCVDGYELARWVREQPHLNSVPVLLLAGVADPVDEQRLHDSGANGVLEKPFEPSHVISRVKELLGLKGAAPAAPGRLVTAPDVKLAPRKPEPDSRQAEKTVAERSEPSLPPAPAGASARAEASMVWPPADQSPGGLVTEADPGHEPFAQNSEPFDMPAPVGDARDWFADDPPQPFNSSAPVYGEEPLRSESAAPADAQHRPGSGIFSRPRQASTAADAFESLLAAEQGHAPPPAAAPAAAELTPAVLDDLAGRVVERLRPQFQAVAVEMRTILAEIVPSAIEQQVAARVDSAVSASVAEAVANHVRDSLVPAVRDTVREVADGAIRGAIADAVAAAVPAAVLDAVRGDGDVEVRAIVRETAERLVSEEIARIRRRA